MSEPLFWTLVAYSASALVVLAAFVAMGIGDWRRGYDISAKEVLLALLMTVLGPVGVVFLLAYYFSEHFDGNAVVIRGRSK